jgi:hypothetical protein
MAHNNEYNFYVFYFFGELKMVEKMQKLDYRENKTDIRYNCKLVWYIDVSDQSTGISVFLFLHIDNH